LTVDFIYKILMPTQVLELSPWDGSQVYTKEEKMDIHIISINLIFAFSL
jgi:hypothetical protein